MCTFFKRNSNAHIFQSLIVDKLRDHSCTDGYRNEHEYIADHFEDERTTITERIFKKRKDNGEEYFKIGLKYWNLHTPEGYQASIDWFYKSAKKKNPEASYYIGLMYFEGYGLPIDENKAFQWYSTACRHGEKYTPATFATFLRGRKKYQFTQVNKPLEKPTLRMLDSATLDV